MSVRSLKVASRKQKKVDIKVKTMVEATLRDVEKRVITL